MAWDQEKGGRVVIPERIESLSRELSSTNQQRETMKVIAFGVALMTATVTFGTRLQKTVGLGKRRDWP